MPFLGKPF